MASTFSERRLPVVGKDVHPMGLALNYGLDERGVAAALERGVNYLLWQRKKPQAVRDALRRDRDRYVIATGPTIGYFGGSVRRTCERILVDLDTDYLDVFQLFWLGVGAAWTEGTMSELVKLRESGKVRAIGVSIHDRPRAARLATEGVLDLFMIRYNAAHPGAEKDIFPHLPTENGRRHAMVAYTATAWRRLLRRPRGWDGELPTPGQCYRFCLSSPFIDVVLCGPANEAQLDENLRALDQGPLGEDEQQWLRRFGRVVHDKEIVRAG